MLHGTDKVPGGGPYKRRCFAHPRLPGTTTLHHIGLLTYAIKDTVSVLYWYEKLSRNGNFFDKIFGSFFFFCLNRPSFHPLPVWVLSPLFASSRRLGGGKKKKKTQQRLVGVCWGLVCVFFCLSSSCVAVSLVARFPFCTPHFLTNTPTANVETFFRIRPYLAENTILPSDL